MWRRKRVCAAACCLLGFVACGILTDVLHRPGKPPELTTDDGQIVILEGCVVQPTVFSADRERFLLELEPHARAQVTLYVREGERSIDLPYGSHIEVEAKVRKPHNFRNPGAFDYVQYLARQDVFWTASAPTGAVKVLPGRCGTAFQSAVMALRSASLSRLEKLYPKDPYQSGMMQALLIGETFQLQKVWTENFRSTGTFHALVISGSHVAALAVFLLLLLRVLFVPAPVAGLCTVGAAWLYALTTGWQAPVVRSAAGMTLFFVAKFFYREGRILNLLAAVAIGFLLVDPAQLFDPSFQLSFLAVAFIGAFAAPLLDWSPAPLSRGVRELGDTAVDLAVEPRVAQFRIEMRLLAETLHLMLRLPVRLAQWMIATAARAVFFVYEIVLISAVIQAGLALPMVVYFHRIGFSGLSANAFVVPLLGWAVPIGFLALFTGWHWLAAVAGTLLRWSGMAVDWHARWEPNWRIPSPPLWLAVGLAACIILCATWRRARLAMALSTLALLVVLVQHPFAPRVPERRLELSAIDVGQGDSLLLTFPDRRVMVIDGGGIPVFGRARQSNLDTGEDVIAPYLWGRSIRRLDVVALTHAHSDHIGGLTALIDNFDVGELWTGATPDSAEWRKLREHAGHRGVRIVPLTAGRRFEFGGARVETLAPAADYLPYDQPKNNDSLVLRAVYGRHTFLLTGDMEKQVERDLVGAVGHADVLKVAHHGSKTSSTDEFLDALHPAFGIISAGAANSYGHPNPDVLDRLAARHVEVLRTDRQGMVTVSSDGRHLSVDTVDWSGDGRGLQPVF